MDNNFVFHHVRLSPQEQPGCHVQPSWELSYVITGSGYRLIGGESTPFAQGDLVLVPPGLEHAWYFNSECVDGIVTVENITLMFTTEMLRQLADIFPVLSRDLSLFGALEEAIVFESGVREEIVERLNTIDGKSDRDRIGDVINLVSFLAANLSTAKALAHKREDNIQRHKFRQVEIFVSCNYGRKLSIDEISRHIGMNKSSFCAFFRRVSGMTFINYLNNFRLEQASYLLKTTDYPINAVAYSCGFQTVSHFNHLFKARHGAAPGSIRQRTPIPSDAVIEPV